MKPQTINTNDTSVNYHYKQKYSKTCFPPGSVRTASTQVSPKKKGSSCPANVARHVEELETRNTLLREDLKAVSAENVTLRSECDSLRQQLVSANENENVGRRVQGNATPSSSSSSAAELETKDHVGMEQRYLLQEVELERMALEYHSVSQALKAVEGELRRKSEHETRLAEFAVRLSHASSIKGVMEVVSKDVPRLLHAERAAFYKIQSSSKQSSGSSTTATTSAYPTLNP
jgi:hypothetical protein